MWAVSVIFGVASVLLVYQGMINLDGGLLGGAILCAFIALFALVFTRKGDDADEH